ncbi:MAG TPA: flagellar biosynthesis protein FlhA, partial [Steroidobacteraceae bacterium]|nr:flagellar biosynthesis protein FlhA [Steroidobacteraceae bacterium]
LGATLLRLGLNIASTRVVLLHGHTGPGAAGTVIKAFGSFVVGGNYAVGIVVFAILVIINFVVVTKGAGRISEVSARFTLDAMPGKQMAIDADLNAGLITQEQALARRQEVREEADFYGSMDGASKFVRGDAVAGLLIVFINIIGGIVIGMAQHQLSFAAAAQTYTLLTIGDGLAAQIPGLLLSVAAAVLVTRTSRPQDITQQVARQLIAEPRTLGVTAGILGILGLIPGMPNVAFLLLAGALGGGARLLARRAAKPAEPAAPPPPPSAPENRELGWDDVRPVEPLTLEVGYRLIPLVDRNQGGELMGRIRGVRKKLTEELGFLIPSVHIRDDLGLPPGSYRLSVQGVPIAQGEALTDRELAINPGHVAATLEGIATRDPAFGLEAVWIEPGRRDHAQSLGYTVVDAGTVIATHLSQILHEYAHELFGHQEAQQLLDQLKKTSPRLVEELTPKTLPMAVVVRVLQDLLRERVPLRNVRVIAETLTEKGAKSQEPAVLVAAVRVALGRTLVHSIGGHGTELPAMSLDPELERLLTQAVQGGGTGQAGVEPGLAERVHTAIVDGSAKQEAAGQPAVLLTTPVLRPWLSRLVRQGAPRLAVLSYDEIPDDQRMRMTMRIGR